MEVVLLNKEMWSVRLKKLVLELAEALSSNVKPYRDLGGSVQALLKLLQLPGVPFRTVVRAT
jgi:hypothetical protein